MESNRERLIRYLQDAHASEVGIESTLAGLLKDTDDPEIRQVISDHREETHQQAQRLRQRLEELGGDTSQGKSMINSMMSAVANMSNALHDQTDRITMDLIQAFATEHLEIGMYTALESFARACGDEQTATLAREIMDEEQQAANKIEPLINQCAAATAMAAS